MTLELASGAAAAAGCFHCGLPVAAGTSFTFDAGGGRRVFCCLGCQAISTSIAGLGLDDYYRVRSAPAPRAPKADEHFDAFDDPVVQERFVSQAPGALEAELILEGLACAACAWLVEQVVARSAGVKSISVNYSTRRARLAWDPATTRLGEVLRAIHALGYSAWPYEEGRLALVEQREGRCLLRRLWVAGLGMMQVMMYAVPGYLAGEGEIAGDAASLMRWAGLVLTAPVMAYSAAPFFRGAWRDLRLSHLGMDVPIALGLLAAFAASVHATVAGAGDVYFDSIAMFVFLITGGRYLELVARRRAGSSLQRLARLVPQMARRVRASDGHEESVAVARLYVGDRVLVRPGETVPADGRLESASASVSQAWLSGESRALARAPGDAVLGGSVNAGDAFVLVVTRLGADTALASIHRLLERALAERPRWADAAQRASAMFVAGILAVAALAGLAWLAIEPSRALWIAVAVLIVTCPCALALATPVALTAGVGALARANVVAASAEAIERLAGATDIVFDKTGTLTHGQPRLLETLPLGLPTRDDCFALASRIARASAHPIDTVFRDASTPIAPASTDMGELPRSVAGQGIETMIEGRRYRLGREGFVAQLCASPLPSSLEEVADTVTWLGDEGGWLARFRIGDELRAEARAAISDLRALGLAVHLLSGDEAGAVNRVAASLGIVDASARATPEDKRSRVADMQRAGARVAMVGDGINDAPVLAQADVSIAMGGGADLAQVHAHAVLLSNSPADLVRAVRIARRTRRVIRQNLFWALAYNIVVIPLAVAGLVTPLIAGIGMSASSLAVVANAARLRR
ncbi:MAG TPA: heavy metal translocating P-type ATPase [Usitatibacter sp.]|nr:heavy metal translocating P-type ATPase [Usitatibacter sp.]